MNFLKIAPFCIAVTFLAAACGGGGSGGGPAPPVPPPIPPASNPPFDSPVVFYVGSTDPAEVSEATAFDVGGGSLAALVFILSSLDFDADLPPGQISETVNGSGGGTAFVRANLSGSGTGWVATEFDNFNDAGVFFDGRLQQLNNGTARTFEFSNLRFAADGQELTLSGTIQYVISSNPTVVRFDVNLGLNDLVSMDTVWLQDVSVTIPLEGNPPTLVSISGRIYDTDQGYIDLTTESGFLLRYFEDGRTLYGGGPLSVDGAGDSMLQVYMLSDDAISFVLEEPGTDPRSLRIGANEVFLLAPPEVDNRQGPIAAAGIRLVDEQTGEIVLDGLASHENQGRWLSHSWNLLLKPTDSAAEVSDANSPVAGFVLDALGSYLFELSVSTQTETTTDSVTITKGSLNTTVNNRARVDRVPAASTGLEVMADGRASIRSRSTDDLQWTLIRPSNSQAVIVSPGGGGLTSFVPDVAGFYALRLAIAGGQGFAAESLEKFVPVDLGFDFHPPVALFQPAAFESDIVAVKALAETNGDERRDLIEHRRDPNLDQDFIGLFSSRPDGYHQPSGEFEFVQHNEFTVGDLDGDGQDEIVAPLRDDVQLYTETAGQLAAAGILPYATECMSSFGNQAAHVTDANGDGLPDIFVTDGCRNQIFLWEQQMNGDFEPQSPTDLANPIHVWVGDIDADGRAEFLDLNLTEVQFYSRQVTGEYVSSIVVPISSDNLINNDIYVADLNGDDLKDILACEPFSIRVVPQSAPGEFDPPLTLASGFFASECRIGDINNDGRNDIVFEAQSGLGEFGFAIQQSDGTMKFVEHVSSGTFRDISIGDINGDGLADLAGDGGIRLGR